jgi:hypothetical protein
VSLTASWFGIYSANVGGTVPLGTGVGGAFYAFYQNGNSTNHALGFFPIPLTFMDSGAIALRLSNSKNVTIDNVRIARPMDIIGRFVLTRFDHTNVFVGNRVMGCTELSLLFRRLYIYFFLRG